MARILLIDDSSFQRRRVAKVVKQAGHEVLAEASNGKDGLELLSKQSPACVLLDLLMPEMDGLQVLAALQERGSKVPVVVVTADIQEEVHQQCMDLGARAIVTKPPKPDELKRGLRTVLEQGGTGA